MTTHPATDDFIDAVHHAGKRLAAMADRIAELENDLETANRAYENVFASLDETRKSLDASNATTKNEGRRRVQAETLAALQLKRADHLQTRLADAFDDLNRVTDVISNTLGIARR